MPGFAIDMHGTGAAAADTASVFRTGELKVVPEHPQQGCVRGFINLNGFVVDAERNHAAGPLRISQTPAAQAFIILTQELSDNEP